mgnify:CR=1 FL=1
MDCLKVIKTEIESIDRLVSKKNQMIEGMYVLSSTAQDVMAALISEVNPKDPTSFEKEITLSIYDLCGRLIYRTYETGNRALEVDIIDKANGSYILKLEIGGKQVQKRIIKFN